MKPEKQTSHPATRFVYLGNYFNSFRLYFVYIRFSMLSLLTASLDNGLFYVFFQWMHRILPSMVLSRLVAGAFQFFVGKHWVFKSSNRIGEELLKYAGLSASLMMLSYGVLTPLVRLLDWNPVFAKIIAEGVIFLLSLIVQKHFVFKAGKKPDITQQNPKAESFSAEG